MKQKEKNFSLKDQLFNREKVSYIAELIHDAYPDFQTIKFVDDVVEKFPELELMDRIHHIVDILEIYLVHSNDVLDYRESLKILLSALPRELDPDKHDDDFGDFILAPYGFFVAKYGCKEEYLDISLDALEQMTKRFSVEWAIRFFLNAFPDQTFTRMLEWARSDNYHVRRLSSEGTRPNLPWGHKISLQYQEPLQILDILAHDERRFVTRSIANHLNDISKKDPKLVVDTLKKWQSQECQDIEYMISHATRTLVKNGYIPAFELLGYSSHPQINMSDICLKNDSVKIGNELEFSFQITPHKQEKLMIDYTIYFIGKTGKLSPKVFKIKKGTFTHAVHITKKHPFKLMTTKALYPGEHLLEITINGTSVGKKSFTLIG
ncbi:DNA alkylation repair protein [Candidatus Gracilibacteria bacterium]|nr:DNA alkylation repair protein [Candidatus Gracilibacteria bacterium]